VNLKSARLVATSSHTATDMCCMEHKVQIYYVQFKRPERERENYKHTDTGSAPLASHVARASESVWIRRPRWVRPRTRLLQCHVEPLDGQSVLDRDTPDRKGRTE
jgi:hypothetical protein